MSAGTPESAVPVQDQVAQANASGHVPVVFIHGLWLLPSSWDRWAGLFGEAGYAPVSPGWPDDPDTVAEAAADPGVFAGKTVGQVADHYSAVIGDLARKPAVIGHSFGGLLAQIIAGRGQSAATVAIDAAPFRGVLPLPLSALRAAFPVLGNPANRHRAVPLTFEQFRYAFANAVSEEEARQLYDTFAVPASGAPLFQAATANFNPKTEAQVDTRNPDRGPLLIISGEKDNTVPRAISHAAYKRQEHNPGVTEFTEVPGRGHSLVIDNGWAGVAQTALDFIKRFTPREPALFCRGKLRPVRDGESPRDGEQDNQREVQDERRRPSAPAGRRRRRGTRRRRRRTCGRAAGTGRGRGPRPAGSRPAAWSCTARRRRRRTAPMPWRPGCGRHARGRSG